MSKFKNIHEIMENWGRGHRKSPPENFLLKEKILSQMPGESEAVKVSPYLPGRSMPWFPVALAVLSVVIFIGGSIDYRGNLSNVSVSLPTLPPALEEKSSYGDAASMSPENAAPGYGYTGYNSGLPITDSREFLKTYYNATVRTRDVQDTREKIEMVVRGLGGRVDSSSGGEKNGYISYAIPAEKLEVLKKEIKELTGKKLFTEQVSSENMLPQKQMIEKEKNRSEDSIDSLNKTRAQLVSVYQKTAKTYEGRILGITQEMRFLEGEWPGASSSRRSEITSRLGQLQSEKNILENQLAQEKRNYQNKLAGVDNEIRSAKVSLEYVNTEDRNLMANVSTVNGTISLSWISLWGMADAYAPGPLVAWVLLMAAFLLYFRHSYQRI